MNNDQFRRIVLDTPSSTSTKASKARGKSTSPAAKPHGSSTPGPGAALGSRMRSSIPMTPRSVSGVDFTRQLAAHRAETDPGQHQPPTKKFKSSAAPKGTKLPTGYQDRTRARQDTEAEPEEGDGEDIVQRIKALEGLVKAGKMDQATFEQQRREMGVGGDIGSTHMVKGLDWELLRRVRAGEDIERGVPEAETEATTTGDGERAAEDGTAQDAEEEFERVLEERGKEGVSAVTREKREKKGTMAAPPPPVVAQRRSRDEILKQLKASRAGSTSTPSTEPGESLGTRFKKIGDSKAEKKRWIEADETGRRREILQITDPDGKVKRKVKWLDKPQETNGDAGLLVPDTSAKPLGMDVPDVPASAPAHPSPAEEDDDIFEGIGADYDPLGDDAGDGSSSESDEEDGKVRQPVEPAPNEKSAEPSKPRNYFSTSATTETETEEPDRSNPLTKDPTLMAALKRAANIRQAPTDEPGDEEPLDEGSSRRSKNFLEEVRRREALDAMDMDMGFGGSRVGDEEDEETVTLERESRGGNKRKRGPKKKKGDKDSASDVLRVLDGRKE